MCCVLSMRVKNHLRKYPPLGKNPVCSPAKGRDGTTGSLVTWQRNLVTGKWEPSFLQLSQNWLNFDASHLRGLLDIKSDSELHTYPSFPAWKPAICCLAKWNWSPHGEYHAHAQNQSSTLSKSLKAKGYDFICTHCLRRNKVGVVSYVFPVAPRLY